MKKEQREVYRVLAEQVNSGIAPFCKYHEGGGSPCEGGGECTHPIDMVRWNIFEGDGCDEPGNDCWGFRPSLKLPDIADIVGIILANGWEVWMYTFRAGEEIRVYGSKEW